MYFITQNVEAPSAALNKLTVPLYGHCTKENYSNFDQYAFVNYRNSKITYHIVLDLRAQNKQVEKL